MSGIFVDFPSKNVKVNYLSKYVRKFMQLSTLKTVIYIAYHVILPAEKFSLYWELNKLSIRQSMLCTITL